MPWSSYVWDHVGYDEEILGEIYGLYMNHTLEMYGNRVNKTNSIGSIRSEMLYSHYRGIPLTAVIDDNLPGSIQFLMQLWSRSMDRYYTRIQKLCSQAFGCFFHHRFFTIPSGKRLHSYKNHHFLHENSL